MSAKRPESLVYVIFVFRTIIEKVILIFVIKKVITFLEVRFSNIRLDLYKIVDTKLKKKLVIPVFKVLTLSFRVYFVKIPRPYLFYLYC